MGSCFSKKNVCASSPPPAALPDPPEKLKSETLPEKKEETAVVKKEIFIIKHRKSHEVERQRSEEEKAEIKKVKEFVDKGKIMSSGNGLDGGEPVRTSSCTKEEVDAILIQCGRLSRSSSTGKAVVSSENGGRKYSGSKRSYDFDSENGKCDDNNGDGDDEAVARERDNRRRERHRQSQGRRRTPSRERERDQAAQQRSGSRERGGRRVSRSPGRRSESPITTNSGANSSSSAANGNSRPGKMVSVPATVPSTNAEPNTAAGSVKRIQVKRNVGGETRSGASPRTRSPARLRGSNENQQQQPISLSRSNSRKAEHSPFRRNPLAEIDTNIISQATPIQKVNADNKTAMNSSSNLTNGNCKNQEQQLLAAAHVGFNVISPVTENPKTSAVTRSRSSRLSRDLDINPETLSNPNNNTSSYTALLLEDIQNFHQKSTTPPPPTAFSLPPCVTKACSILEAVADLNSSIGSNLSTTDLRRNASEQMNKTYDNKAAAANPIRKAKQEIKDPIMESEIVASDDLMQPSFHKYVTVRRGGVDDDLEEQESSGSNSFAGSQQQWASSSCWEPNSAESTDRWMSSSMRSVSQQNDVSPVGYQRHTPSDEGGGKKHSAAKKREADHQHQQSGIGKGGRIANRVSHLASAAVAST